MTVCLGLAQCGFPSDGDVLKQVERFAADAAARGVHVLVFPEDLMSPRPLSAPELQALAEPLLGPFVQGMREIAARYSLWMAFTFYEKDDDGGAPFNAAVVVDNEGKLRGIYQKTHLYDAHGVCESERTQPGSSLCVPIPTPYGTLGLAICYDLRFPEVARSTAVNRCAVLLVPSAWHDGPQKAQQWETLVRARAIENEFFVVAVDKAGEKYVGKSLVADPMGRVVAMMPGKEEGLLVCEIDLDEVKATRSAMPVLEHRRPELYGMCQ